MKFTVVTLAAAALTFGLFATPLTADAQQAGKVWRIGVLVTWPRPRPASPHQYTAFPQELRDLGYVEGQNVIIEWRHTEGNPERRRREAATLAAWKPDVVVTASGIDALTLRDLGTDIPIVVAAGGDLVAMGLVESLARPGRNVTGVQVLQSDLAAKRLQLLKELMPRLQNVALLHQTPLRAEDARLYNQIFAMLDTAGRTFSIRMHRFTFSEADELVRIFADIKRAAEAVIVVANPFMAAHRPRLVELAVHHRLPTMHDVRSYVEAGGLASYSPRMPDLYRRAAQYVDRILKGEKPADMPVEQPTRFELIINMKRAKALGLTIPPSLLLRADQVIE